MPTLLPQHPAGALLAHPREPEGWLLTAEGGAIHLAERTAVVADVHLGYEWARGNGGDMVPPHSLGETIDRLDRMLARAAVDRLIVAGDLVESATPCPRTSADLRRLRGWLEGRGVEMVALRGNHDPPTRPPRPATLVVAGWTIGHGDRPIPGDRALFGHHHPALRVGGLCAPCFLVGPSAILLPAFSTNAAGVDVLRVAVEADLRGGSIRCVAGLDGTLLDFGPIESLALRIGRINS